jgi:hypothetical protein
MNDKQLRGAIEQLLEDQPDNQRLRDPLFAGLTWFWGPRLYARGKAVFRPFIHSQSLLRMDPRRQALEARAVG